MTVTRRLLLVAVVLCSFPGGVLSDRVGVTGCVFTEDGQFVCMCSNLTSVPDNLPHNVRMLGMFFNRLPVLKNKELLNKGCANILELDLSSNHIAVLEDEAFSGLASVRVVRLQNNHITVFNKDIFKDNLKLHTLYLGANPLTLPSSDSVPLLNSASLTELTFFYCNSTGLSEGWFSETPNITRLYIELTMWPSLGPFVVNHPELMAETSLNMSFRYAVCPFYTVLPLTELGEDPVNTPDVWNNTFTCDCCLSLANYALEKQAQAFCLSEGGPQLASPGDLVHLQRCYATFKEGFGAGTRL